MTKLPDESKITKVWVGAPQPASLCSVEIRKYVRAPGGEDMASGRGTGFHYRDSRGVVWLVTNWHVLTGRRPDDPSRFVGEAAVSPYKISITYQSNTAGQFLVPLELPLYDEQGAPVWVEYKRELGVDLAAIPINLPQYARCPCVQDFSERDEEQFVPGLDLTIIGMAFPHGQETPYPIWKGARVASEPAYMVMGVPQVLVDGVGVPGMSGSPVYRIARGISVPKPPGMSKQPISGASSTDWLLSLDLSKAEAGNVLKFVGVYAGSTGTPALDRLSLGRMFIASFVDALVAEALPGVNPNPLQIY